MSAHENMKMEMDPNITPRQFYKYKDMLKVFINRLIVLEADYQNFYSYKYSGTSSTISFNYTCRDADIIMNDNFSYLYRTPNTKLNMHDFSKCKFESFYANRALVSYSTNSVMYIDSYGRPNMLGFDSLLKLEKAASAISNIDLTGLILDKSKSFEELYYRKITNEQFPQKIITMFFPSTGKFIIPDTFTSKEKSILEAMFSLDRKGFPFVSRNNEFFEYFYRKVKFAENLQT